MKLEFSPHIFKKYSDTKISRKPVSGKRVVLLGRTDGQTDGRKKGRDETEAAATIRQQPGIFESTRQSLLRRCRLCIAVGGRGGRTFEHLL
jgi:hypothetical protein